MGYASPCFVSGTGCIFFKLKKQQLLDRGLGRNSSLQAVGDASIVFKCCVMSGKKAGPPFESASLDTFSDACY